jgi:hypothetical protein
MKAVLEALSAAMPGPGGALTAAPTAAVQS